MKSRRHRLVVVDAPGGPHPQFYWEELAGDYDIWVACFVPSTQPQDKQRATQFVDAREIVEVSTPNDVRGVVRELVGRAKPDGVLAMSERVTHDAQCVAWETGLPANSPETLVALRDKRAQRRRLAAAGIPVPAQRELRDLEGCRKAAAELLFPLVVKPAVGMGGIATFRAADEGELLEHWRCASELVRADSRISHHEPVLVAEEELLGAPSSVSELGDFASVEALWDDGELCVLAVTDKLPLVTPFRESGSILPSSRDRAEKRAIVEMTRLAHQALGITFGASHTELKLTPDGPRIIEVNGRPGGGVAEMLRHAANYSYIGALARVSVGATPPRKPTFHGFAANLHPQPPLGRHIVADAPSRDELYHAEPLIVDVKAITSAEDIVDSRHGTASHMCVVDAAADSHGALMRLSSRVRDRFKFRPASGEVGITGGAS